MKSPSRKIIIVGASSGIGMLMARIYARRGCKVGVSARRIEPLQALQAEYPDLIYPAVVDVTAPDAADRLKQLADQIGGADTIIDCAGTGYLNPSLELNKDLNTVRTNCVGFTQIADAAFNYLADNGGGRFAAISSIAATMGLGLSASYSASKRFEATYMQALAQLSRLRRVHVSVTDIRPGFAATPLLDANRHYPMMMQPDKVARQAVRAIDRRRRVAVIDRRWRLLFYMWRLIPGWLWVRLPIKISL